MERIEYAVIHRQTAVMIFHRYNVDIQSNFPEEKNARGHFIPLCLVTYH